MYSCTHVKIPFLHIKSKLLLHANFHINLQNPKIYKCKDFLNRDFKDTDFPLVTTVLSYLLKDLSKFYCLFRWYTTLYSITVNFIECDPTFWITTLWFSDFIPPSIEIDDITMHQCTFLCKVIDLIKTRLRI